MAQASITAAPRAPRTFQSQDGNDASWIGVTTLALWALFLVVGLFGFVLPYWRPLPVSVVAPHPPVEAQLIDVSLSASTLPDNEPARAPQDQATPPPMIENTPPVAAPPLLAVAEPSPAIAFALPVEGPVRVVEASQAAVSAQNAPANPVENPRPAVQTLVFGRGEGVQPAPKYPPRAEKEGMQGTVFVQFTVGADGRVLAADASRPSPWKLLNDEAVRVVRDSWRFRPGAIRFYEVAIRFKL
jgi:protein TonB